MAIYDHKYGDLSYFRVFRAWGGQEYQEYVRIKRSRDAAYKKAQEIDTRLAKQQQAYYKEQALLPEYHIHSDGTIRGLRRVVVKRKGRAPAEVFELRINVPWETDIKRTTISISVHGEPKAFELAVDRICQWYGLSGKSDIRPALLDQYKHYSKDAMAAANVAEVAIQKAKDEFASIAGGLVKGFKKLTA